MFYFLNHFSSQSRRCQGLCGTTFGCFGVSVVNNDCGVQCDVGFYKPELKLIIENEIYI